MKPSGVQYATNRWPLIELGMPRGKCIEWMKGEGYPEPPKSACTFCPYHSDAQWLHLKRSSPDEFQEAVDFERDWNVNVAKDTRASQLKGGVVRLHRSLKPLNQVEFVTAETAGQTDMFGNECEGLCGL